MKKFIEILIVMILATFTGLAQDQLDYTREQHRRSAARQPTERNLPKALVRVIPQEGREGRNAHVKPVHGEHGNYVSRAPHHKTVAESAAWQMAREITEAHGFTEYYHVGFHRGLKQALSNENIGNEDYRQGLRNGTRDPYAMREGNRIGFDAANEEADRVAEADVAREFRNLQREPQFRAFNGRINIPSLSATSLDEPVLENVFRDNPLHRFGDWWGRGYRFPEGWSPDPLKLYTYNDYHDFYRAQWREPSFGFDQWCRYRRSQRIYNGLASDADREQFRRWFHDAYVAYLDYFYNEFLTIGYDRGFNDGWSYGCHINYEWSYRRGYHDAATRTILTSAEDSFHRAFPRSYDISYRRHFESWMNTAHLEVVEVTARDENNNGVFEPGEDVFVALTVANYGGAEGREQLVVNGPDLERSQRLPLRLERRFLANHEIRVGLRPNASPWRSTKLNVQMGSEQRQVSLDLAYPIKISQRPVVLERDNFNGRLLLEVQVENISSKNWRGGQVGHQGDMKSIGRIAAGGQNTFQFEINGLATLDMLAGEVSADFQVLVAQTQYHHQQYRVSADGLDLNNRDLLQYMVDLAQAQQYRKEEARRCAQLMLRRLEVDWNRAVTLKGNPYKRDLKRGSAETALGELVQVWEQNERQLSQPQVFTQLRGKCLALVPNLPGTHPFLKKQFKKLANKIN